MSRPIVVLGREDSWHVQQIAEAGRRLGRVMRIVPFERLRGDAGGDDAKLRCGDFNLLDAASVIVRGIPPGSLEQVVFRMDALHRLEAAGVEVLNPSKAIECCVDKYLATSRLHAAGLPTPRTSVCEGLDEALAAFTELGGNVVVKPLFGSEGRGILRLENPSLAYRVLRTIVKTQSVVYLQEWVDHPGFDVRVLVLDGRVLAAMKRTAVGDFRTNVSCGGRFASFELSEAWGTLALRSAAAVGARFAGVDLLTDRDERVFVIEVNSVPGFQAILQTTTVDIPAELVGAMRP